MTHPATCSHPRCVELHEVYARSAVPGKRADGKLSQWQGTASPSEYSQAAMHELSIATNIVEIASQHVREAGGGRVAAVTLRIGRLSCVHEDALRYSFELVREGTPLAGADLRIVAVPVRVWCPRCAAEFEIGRAHV